mmetsp:Transcript_90652/g.174523  ORF Transcript_90652/g.174523 Transcript_90652/m.174523 type:complete len:250 (+) Transcript_90652:440-1189(+)
MVSDAEDVAGGPPHIGAHGCWSFNDNPRRNCHVQQTVDVETFEWPSKPKHAASVHQTGHLMLCQKQFLSPEIIMLILMALLFLLLLMLLLLLLLLLLRLAEVLHNRFVIFVIVIAVLFSVLHVADVIVLHGADRGPSRLLSDVGVVIDNVRLDNRSRLQALRLPALPLLLVPVQHFQFDLQSDNLTFHLHRSAVPQAAHVLKATLQKMDAVDYPLSQNPIAVPIIEFMIVWAHRSPLPHPNGATQLGDQ